jgi:hypothetical protein
MNLDNVGICTAEPESVEFDSTSAGVSPVAAYAVINGGLWLPPDSPPLEARDKSTSGGVRPSSIIVASIIVSEVARGLDGVSSEVGKVGDWSGFGVALRCWDWGSWSG